MKDLRVVEEKSGKDHQRHENRSTKAESCVDARRKSRQKCTKRDRGQSGENYYYHAYDEATSVRVQISHPIDDDDEYNLEN